MHVTKDIRKYFSSERQSFFFHNARAKVASFQIKELFLKLRIIVQLGPGKTVFHIIKEI